MPRRPADPTVHAELIAARLQATIARLHMATAARAQVLTLRGFGQSKAAVKVLDAEIDLLTRALVDLGQEYEDTLGLVAA